MSEKYIRENKKSCVIVKANRTYAKTANLEDAIFIRDMLVENGWDLNKTPQIIKKDEDYLVLTVYDEKIYMLGKYDSKPDEKTVEKLIKIHRRNPNNSRYGLNISKVFDTYVIRKQIAGDDYIFGYYDSLQDAEFVRNFLLDNMWNVNAFSEINYCEDTKDYKVVRVIDDKAYVIDSFYSDNIDLKKCYEDFLTKISKHKYGLDSYPHLDALKDKIPDLEEELGVKVRDDYWDFTNADDGDALNQIVFNLSPFKQSIYDAISDKISFEDIKKSLIRYKSKNFESKITKHLDEMIESGLIEMDGDFYKKKN